MLLWSNSRYPFFYIFAHNRCVQDILPNFNLLRTTELMFFGPLFPRIYDRHWFSLFQVWVENWRKWHHFLKNTARVEIIITINVENCTNLWAKAFVILMRTAILLVIIILTRAVFLRKWRHFQPRPGTRKINGGRKFSEINVQKTWVILFVVDWNLARYFRKTCCVRKCKKMGIENLIVVAL